MKLLLAILSTAVLAAPAHAYLNARALALSGSLSAWQGGIDAVHLNPASAYRQGARRQLELVGLSARAVNNAFTVQDYNRYSGAYLSDDDKTYLLDQVPESGLTLSASAGLQTASLWASPVAVTIWSEGVAAGTLSRDAVELLLYGNATMDTVILTGTKAESYLTASMGFTYAFPAVRVGGGTLAAGATLRYVKGMWVEEVTESHGELITASTQIDADAYLLARTASSGRGMAADLGILLDHGSGWNIGLSATNLLGSMRWDGNPEAHTVRFTVDSVSLLNASDDLVASSDSTYAIAPFTTRLPTTLRLGACRSWRRMSLMGQWEQGLGNGTGSSTHPRMSGGAEWLLTRAIPFRAGLSFGGGGGVSGSLGSGFYAGAFYVDVAAGLASGPVWGEAKGLALGLNTGFRF